MPTLSVSCESVAPPTLELTENAVRVLESRYLDRVDGKVIETPQQLFSRVAKCVAAAEDEAAEHWERKFYELMVSGKFLPNSPTLMNAGRRLGMLSGCFVLPVLDDIDAIFQAIKHTAAIQKMGGGTGFAFDELRPCGAYIASSGGQSSGPISFWRVFAEVTSAIQQGSFRRGANMAILAVDHPDIIKFLFAKQDLHQFSNYNISIKIPDTWMELVKCAPASPFVVKWEDQKWFVPRSIVSRCETAVSQGRSGEAEPRALDTCYKVSDLTVASVAEPGDVLSVGEVFDIIVKHAWATGEPGLFFIDRVRETEPTPEVARIQATNPCGEEPLLPNESCNLGSINLGKYVVNRNEGVLTLLRLPRGVREQRVDWDGLSNDVYTAIRFLDNVVSVNKYPTKEITATCLANRKIGLGVMGFADALLKLGVPYDSQEGVWWGERFMRAVTDCAISASVSLADEKGAFPNCGRSIWKDKRPMRNACVTSIAPTGTISIIAGASGGIEPLFSFVFKRQILGGETLLECHKGLKKYFDAQGSDSKAWLDFIFEHGTLQGCEGLPAGLTELYKSARDISPEWHIRMQAAFQKHTTASVSKTVNLPASAPETDVRAAYLLAFKLRCKGVTVYRDGARAMQPMALKNTAVRSALFVEPVTVKLPLPSVRTKYATTYGSMHLHVTLEQTPDGRFREREIFFDLGRSGDSIHPMTATYGRLSSILLRVGVRLEVIIDQLRGHVARSEKINGSTGGGTSLPSELAMGLLDYLRYTAGYRDSDGLLVSLPFSTAALSASGNGSSNGVGGGNDELARFIKRVMLDSSSAGSLRTPCSTPGCRGQLIYTEGCNRCTECGLGGCD